MKLPALLAPRRLVSSCAGLGVLCFSILSACSNPSGDQAQLQTEQEVAQLRQANQELQRLQAENQELSRLRRDETEFKRLVEQSKDLAQLRDENLRLRSELQALKAPKPKPQ